MKLTRRRLLTGVAGAAGTGVLAGCSGGEAASGTDSDGTAVQATFFVFGDVASRVAGDAAAADLLVPVGQHGHGWEPGPSVREDIRDADLLVHGAEGFQPWVDSIRSDLDADDADVSTVDVSAGLDLLAAGDEREDGDHDEHTENHEDEHDEHTENHEEEHTDDHDDGNHEGEDEHDHDSGVDPHFWMDPLRVEEAVGTVERGLVDVDGDNADAYAENADQFRGDLADLHEDIEATVADASKDAVLVAGHNSLRYFGDRYGVDVEALTTVSPDDRPTHRDIERAQEVIETHDLQYICSDPLESQEAADQLVAETDAEAVLPLTAMPGLTDAWTREEWGYVDVMETVNLPTLERALDAE